MSTIRSSAPSWPGRRTTQCAVWLMACALIGCDRAGPVGPHHDEDAPRGFAQRDLAAVASPNVNPLQDSPPNPSLNANSATPLNSAPATEPSPLVVRPSLRPYTDWSVSETAADSLGRIGAAAVPELAKLLHDSDPAVRQMSARILARIGPEAAEAVPDLEQLLADEHPQVRRSAARALGQIGPAAASAVPALMRLLDASESDPTETPMEPPAAQ